MWLSSTPQKSLILLIDSKVLIFFFPLKAVLNQDALHNIWYLMVFKMWELKLFGWGGMFHCFFISIPSIVLGF